jgi:hypothetical protein
MNNISTVEEFCKSFKPTGKTWQENFHQTIIEFAKLHVEAALKNASKVLDVDNDGDYIEHPTTERILNAYPLTLIK